MLPTTMKPSPQPGASLCHLQQTSGEIHLSHSCNLALLRACSLSCLMVQVELTVLCDEDDDPVVCTSDLDLTLHNITFRLATTPTTSNLPHLFSLSCHLSLSQLHPISPHPVLRHLPTPLTLFTSLYPPHTLTSLPYVGPPL